MDWQEPVPQRYRSQYHWARPILSHSTPFHVLLYQGAVLRASPSNEEYLLLPPSSQEVAVVNVVPLHERSEATHVPAADASEEHARVASKAAADDLETEVYIGDNVPQKVRAKRNFFFSRKSLFTINTVPDVSREVDHSQKCHSHNQKQWPLMT